MEKEFVPYELALRMKTLGFDEPCFGYFTSPKELIIQQPKDKNGVYVYFAPTYSQAFRWFREKHNLKSFIQPIPDDVDTYIFAYGTKEIEHDDLDYLTHEEAEIACLIKLIEIVEKELIN
jgi:hypothetical protein